MIGHTYSGIDLTKYKTRSDIGHSVAEEMGSGPCSGNITHTKVLLKHRKHRCLRIRFIGSNANNGNLSTESV